MTGCPSCIMDGSHLIQCEYDSIGHAYPHVGGGMCWTDDRPPMECWGDCGFCRPRQSQDGEEHRDCAERGGCDPEYNQCVFDAVEEVLGLRGVAENPPNWKTNRDKVRQARGRSHWCNGCDMERVNDGSRCRVCGSKDVRRREKP